jgi:hypothetical protein
MQNPIVVTNSNNPIVDCKMAAAASFAATPELLHMMGRQVSHQRLCSRITWFDILGNGADGNTA